MNQPHLDLHHQTTTSRIIAERSRKALLHNYRVIENQVPGLKILPMIKANAYGHGARWVAEILSSKKSLHGLGVATIEEGLKLRENFPHEVYSIFVFSGATPWTEEKGQICEKFRLTPVLTRWEDFQLFHLQGWASRLHYEIKFNTGMNRLGIPLNLREDVAKVLRNLPAESRPSGILTHLASGEEPRSPISRKQLEGFISLRETLSFLDSRCHFHLANSAAIWNAKEWKVTKLSTVVRPGLALYGIRPHPTTSPKGLRAVMTLKAQIIARVDLKPGEATGYGGVFKNRTKKPLPIAILAAGYADGIHRTLGGTGSVWIDGKKQSFLGRISMDLSAVSCSPRTKTGTWVEILGNHIDPWQQALAGQTIPYELLTSTSERVIRKDHE